MSKLSDFRKQYPQYDNMSDAELSYRLYKKFYGDRPLMVYANDLGLNSQQKMDFLKYAGEQGDSIKFNTATNNQPSYGGPIVGGARSVLQGMTVGGGDEIVGAGVAAAKKFAGDQRPFTDIYKQEQQRELQRVEDFRSDYPKASLLSELSGGLIVPLGATKTVKGAMATGGSLGGLAAFLNSDGSLTERALNMPLGAILGTIFGGGVAATGQALSGQLGAIISKKAQQAAAAGGKALDVLKREGFIEGFENAQNANEKPAIKVDLKYFADGRPAIAKARRVSTPGRRQYFKTDKLPQVSSGLGVAIVSTSKGVMTDHEARKSRVGGEVLALVG